MKTQIRKTQIAIDGSEGEGGGQILRTSLALSLITGSPFEMERIRAGRQKPGLLRQHLTAVRAAAEIGGAKAEGAELGSQTLSFAPGPVVPGHYRFAVGTAGSAVLVLQTVLPALLCCTAPSWLELEGGTHNPLAPTFDYLTQVFLPILNRMGPSVTATLGRPGFYPAGGGKFSIAIDPAPRLAPLVILERGEMIRREAKIMLAGLAGGIAVREMEILREKLLQPEEKCRIETLADKFGPGNVISVEIVADQITELFTGFGVRGVLAETVVEKLIREVRDYLAAGVPVGEHLADQLILPFALAGAGAFKTGPLSLHSRTNIGVVRKFLPVPIAVEELENRNCVVRFGA